ncbi:PPC domain-containing protein [Mechercharimyces sp. CAU 1602]|uniref:PPC domain-containing protein n=1 Tax=Mechercharimyces sp. CAU 1602 TaxID=2973933 RepID=UPI0037C8C6F0
MYRALTGDDDGGGGDDEDTFEPNDSIATAYGPINSGEEYESFIFDGSDEDYYKLEAAAGTINISLKSLPGDYDLYLYNASGSRVARSWNGSTSDESISYDAAAGTYYIRVVGWNGASSKSDSYLLKATFTSDDGGGEGDWYYEDKRFDTDHPYSNYYNKSHTYTKSGASKVALYFSRFETESNYDFVYIKDKNGTTKETFDGDLEPFWVIVDGDKITANLVSDFSITDYGYSITEVAYFIEGEAPTKASKKSKHPIK